jgi:hypothetical protein
MTSYDAEARVLAARTMWQIFPIKSNVRRNDYVQQEDQ